MLQDKWFCATQHYKVQYENVIILRFAKDYIWQFIQLLIFSFLTFS